jgi:hypothetical protein
VKKRYIKPWLFGIIAGAVFVSAEAVFNFYPPSAYVFCLSCHTRDLVNTAVNALFHASFQTAAVSGRVLMVTSPAVILGAFLSARLFKEHSPQKSSRPVLFFIYGFIVMITGIVIFGCPTRIVLRSGYGDLYGIAALVGMFGGIWVGTVLLRKRAARTGGIES